MSDLAYNQIVRSRNQGLTDDQIAEMLGLSCSEDVTLIVKSHSGGREITLDELTTKLKRRATEVLGEVLEEVDNPQARVAAAKILLTGEGEMPELGPAKLLKMIEQMKRVTSGVKSNILELPETTDSNSSFDNHLVESGAVI